VSVPEAVGGLPTGVTRHGGVSRRSFVTSTIRAGSVGSAALWVAPHLSSISVAQGAVGTKPPDEPSPTEDVVPPATVGGGAPSGVLPVTGADSLFLAAVGGMTIAAGRALVELSRYLEDRASGGTTPSGPPGTVPEG
jgi:hypothetical protein